MNTQGKTLDVIGMTKYYAGTSSAAYIALKRMPRDLTFKTCIKIIDISTKLLSPDLVLANAEEVGAKEKICRKWHAVLAIYPYGTLSQLHFALSTLCLSRKLNVLFKKGNEHNLEKYDIKNFRGSSV